jgi:hypothetical protein
VPSVLRVTHVGDCSNVLFPLPTTVASLPSGYIFTNEFGCRATNRDTGAVKDKVVVGHASFRRRAGVGHNFHRAECISPGTGGYAAKSSLGRIGEEHVVVAQLDAIYAEWREAGLVAKAKAKAEERGQQRHRWWLCPCGICVGRLNRRRG